METYIETYGGHFFPLLSPTTEDVCIEDIAYALSNLCRFTGHSSRFYSVAEHSWHCANMLQDQSKTVQLSALLHDASEAYCGDVSSPLKQLLPEYKKIEHNIASVIYKKYNLEYPYSSLIAMVDTSMLNTEAYYLMLSKGNNWELWKTVSRPKIDTDRRPQYLSPKVAREVFLSKFHELLAP